MADCIEGVPEDVQAFIKKAKDPKEALEQLRIENARKRKLTAMSKQAQQKLSALINQHPEGPVVGLRAILTNDLSAKANNSSVEYRQKALQGMVESFIPELKEKLSTTNLGFSRDKELGKDFVRAIFGDEGASDTAKKLAKEWENASEFMRKRSNEYGTNIGKLDYGYIPQSHDRIAIGKAGRDEWTQFIKPLLKGVEDLDLNYVFDTLSTGGLNKVKEGASLGGGKSLANKNADHRVLHFKDADSWTIYQEKFGTPDPMATIDNHIRGLTTDMSMLEILGPNPQHMFETLKVQVQKMQQDQGFKGGFDSYTDSIWNVVNGKVDNDIEGIGRIASGAQTLRAVNTATMLGSATLSAASDSASLFVNSVYHGMNPFKTMGKMVKSLNIKTHDDAIRLGLGADVFNSEVSKRFSELGSGWWAKASEALMRATFMNVWTEAGRKAFQTEFYHKLMTVKKDAKPGELPKYFKEAGFTQERFDKLNFDNLEVEDQIRILEMVQEQTDYAVLMPGARVRAITTAGREKGTAAGEFTRTSSQFSSFTLTLMQQQGARMFKQGDAGSRIAYGSSLIAFSTLIASGSMMAKDAAKGYGVREGFDPFDKDVDVEDNAKFWSAALLQGGGMGIFGDLLFSDATRYGNTPIPTALGPSASVVEDAYRLSIGNVQEAIKGDDTHIGSELVDFANRHANPANTFYTKLLIEQYVARNLKILLDEDYEKNERRKLRKRRKEYGQEQFDWLQD